MKRCPFCGYLGITMRIGGFCECDKCKAGGPRASNPEDAIVLWNQRVAEYQGPQEINVNGGKLTIEFGSMGGKVRFYDDQD